MPWVKEYSVGVPKFDDDHELILNLIDTYLTRSNSGLDLKTVRIIIDQLGDYSQNHFKAEEKVNPRWIHSSVSNLGFSNLYETYSSVALSFRSSIGKILLKTRSKPLVKSPASELNSVNSL